MPFVPRCGRCSPSSRWASLGRGAPPHSNATRCSTPGTATCGATSPAPAREFFNRIWWLWLVTPFAFVVFPALPFLYAYYKAVEWRWWLSGIRFGAVTLESRLESLQDFYWKVIGWSILLSMGMGFVGGLLGAAAVGITKAVSGPVDAEAFATSTPILIVTVIGYLGFALALSVVVRLYLSRDLWARVLETTIVSNIEAAANVTARGDLASAVGEGIADGLDVAGF